MLFERERWARAAALAILAVEESGKAHLCHVWAFHVPPTLDVAAWQPFWNAFRAHPEKVDRWLPRVDGMGGCSDFGAWKKEATTTDRSKQACLYVDYILPEQAVTTPDRVTVEDARQFMDMAREARAYWDRAGWGADEVPPTQSE